MIDTGRDFGMEKTALAMHETLPDKGFFRTQEIASLLMVKPHVISYLEAEFTEIKPQKNKDGQKVYRREDVILLSAIKHLLYDKKFTVAGARKILRESDDCFSFPQHHECEKPKEEKIDFSKYESSFNNLSMLKNNLLALLKVVNEFGRSMDWPAWKEMEAIRR